jgi:uncharacterized protein DUF6292
MNTDPYDKPAKGLGRYVRAVAAQLGLPAVAADYELDEPATAYIALDQRSNKHRELDLMLLWHEEHGWAVAVETDPSDPAIVLAYLGDRVLPHPGAVADAVRALLAGERAGQPDPPVFRTASDLDELDDLLAAYAPAPRSRWVTVELGHGQLSRPAS